jgi:lipopolysaccharide assembly protein A
MAIRFVLSLVCAILVAIFALQNSGSVEVSFLFAKFSISQALVILFSTIIGAIIVMILAAISQIKLNLKIRNSSKTIARLQEENKLLSEKVGLFTKEPTGKNDKAGISGEFTSTD